MATIPICRRPIAVNVMGRVDNSNWTYRVAEVESACDVLLATCCVCTVCALHALLKRQWACGSMHDQLLPSTFIHTMLRWLGGRPGAVSTATATSTS
jgi:hypothetical protein